MSYIFVFRTVWLTKIHLGCHLPKDISFDILNFVNQLYQSRSTNLNDFEPKKIYFSENPFLDLLVQGKEVLIKNILTYNKFLSKPGRGRKVIRNKSTKKVEIKDKTGFQKL